MSGLSSGGSGSSTSTTKPLYKCCGVLCYALDEPTQHVYFLLGKETYDNLWCDFSGGPKRDEPYLDTAVREFEEESMGLIMPAEKLKQELLAHRYTLCLRMDNRVTFVKRIPFRPELPQLFADYRADMLYEGGGDEEADSRLPPEWLEKSEIGWFSINKLNTLIRHDKIAHVSNLRLRKYFVNTLANILNFFVVR